MSAPGTDAGARFERVGVVGGGTMGAGIAEVTARAGCNVVVLEVSEPALAAAQQRVSTSLDRSVRGGRLTEPDRDTVLARIAWTLSDADLADRGLVIEAAPEDETLKLELFRRLDGALKPGAVLASNTSSIPLVKMAAVTGRPPGRRHPLLQPCPGPASG